MRPREIATAAGLGQAYFYAYWTFTKNPMASIGENQRKVKSLFIHIPKTAGMSIHRTLFNSEAGHGHAPAFAFRRREAKRFDEYFTFSLLRQPTDRFVSAFYYLQNSPLTPRDKAWGAENLQRFDSPNDILTAVRHSKRERGRIMSFVHFNPQAWYITDRKGNVIVDYLGRLETFDESVGEIAARMGKSYIPTQINKSQRPRDINIDPENLDFLHKFYADDYRIYEEHFGRA